MSNEQDHENITQQDETTVLTVANWKRGKVQIINDLNHILQDFQKAVIETQGRMNLVWNTMNAIVRALYNKGLITDEDIVEAGKQLMNEHKANLEKIKAAEGKMPEDLTPVPFEHVQRNLIPQMKKTENN